MAAELTWNQQIHEDTEGLRADYTTGLASSLTTACSDITAIKADVEPEIADIKAKTDTIVWTDVTDIKSAVITEVADIKAKTDTIVWTDVTDIKSAVITEVADILADTNELQTDWTNGG